MCCPCVAEFEQLTLKDFPWLLKHYSQNPTSPGSVGLPWGQVLAFVWDARILTFAELKQKIDHMFWRSRKERKLSITAVLWSLNVVLATKKKEKKKKSHWRSYIVRCMEMKRALKSPTPFTHITIWWFLTEQLKNLKSYHSNCSGRCFSVMLHMQIWKYQIIFSNIFC